MWLKLQTRMVTSIPGFTRSSLACQRKFNSLIKQHKKDICAMRESGQAHYACKFFHSLDRWWRINGTVMKHVMKPVTGSRNLNRHVRNSELPATNTKDEGAKKDAVMKEEDGGEEGKKNWVDSEVGTLIDLRWDMEPGLVQNIYKSGMCPRAFKGQKIDSYVLKNLEMSQSLSTDSFILIAMDLEGGLSDPHELEL